MESQSDTSADSKSSKEQFDQLRALAKKGDPAARVGLREFLEDHPEVWKTIGDFALHARESLFAWMGGDDVAATESFALKMRQLENELVGESTSALVRLLAEQCAICWAQYHIAEFTLTEKERKGVPPSAEAHKRVSMIQLRYLRAVTTMASVSRLTKEMAPDKPKLKLVS